MKLQFKVRQAPMNHIPLKIKRLNAFGIKENHSLVCSKCILPNEKTLDDLKWWFQMNSQVGQNFVDVCNPLGKISYLNQIKSMFGDFVHVRSMTCFPNLKSSEKVNKPIFDDYTEYITTNDENKMASPLELYRRMDILNEVIINECYFDYIDKYR